MKFINKGEPIQIRIGDSVNCYWITLKKNELIDLPKKQGKKLGLVKLKTTEGQIGDEIVETKQIETDKLTDNYTPDDLYFKELINIRGIGSKTAEDIVTWGTKEKLIEYIQKGENLPFRDDVEEKLKREYGE